MQTGKFLFVFFIAVLFSHVNAQWISPGDLSNGHKALEGINNCTLCHVIGGKIQAERCFACHTKLKAEIEEKHGYHYLVKNRSCTECHKEHRGRDFPLIQMNQDTFKTVHARLGFKLEGKHAQLKCEECHKTPGTYRGLSKNCLTCHDDSYHGRLGDDCTKCHSFESFKPSTFKHKGKDLAAAPAHKNVDCYSCHTHNQFKNLDTTCTSCHKDEHKGQLAQNCEECHSKNDTTFVVAQHTFDHNKKARFKVEGKHATLTCDACHHDGIYELKYANCSDCHADAHKGEFKDDCAKCHTQNGFEHNTFKHEKPFYELQGAHKKLACEECHPVKRFKDTPQNCSECHHDPHKGRMSTDDCQKCHTQDSFSPSIFKHEKPNYVLTGKHTTLPCSDCHQERNFAPADTACASCHQEEHKGQLSLDCQQCHNTKAFSPSTFKHKKQDFQAQGKHAQIKCEECHRHELFELNSNCTTCHTDVHYGELGANCTQCHTYDKWTHIIYDHNQTDFILKGQHRTLTCEQCHKNGKFEATGKECYDCHKDPHQKSFGTDCERCHTEDNWMVRNFNHELNTGYALVGAHSRLACTECHTNLRDIHLPLDCYGCHKNDYLSATVPNHKAAGFGTDCQECHRQTDFTWQQGYWEEHESIFHLRTSSAGHHDHFICTDCHPSNNDYRQYNCLACHLREETDAQHSDVRRYKYQNSKCLKCHPVGEVEE